MELCTHIAAAAAVAAEADALINPLHSLLALKLLEIFFANTSSDAAPAQLLMWEVHCNSIQVHPSSTTHGLLSSRLLLCFKGNRQGAPVCKQSRCTVTNASEPPDVAVFYPDSHV